MRGLDTAVVIGRGRLWTFSSGGVLPVSLEYTRAFAPATHCLYEWTEYWVEFLGADALQVGDTWIHPVKDGLFRLRFENQLGLTSIQPFVEERPLHPPLWVEVISPKFRTPPEHLAFYRTLLDDLFSRAARLPFQISALTGRNVTEAPRPPSPLFTFHFLRQEAGTLRRALATVQAAPHRQLHDHEAFVPLVEATEADAEVLTSILHSPEDWAPARRG